MSGDGVLEMESLQLAQYAVQVPCYICGGNNSFKAELCRDCQAPMALAQQTDNQKVEPRMIAVLGASGAGKTVYLGMLTDMLSRERGGMQMLARGAFSITLQQTTMEALSKSRFPEKTPSEPDRWNWVHCEVRTPRQRRSTELILPDMAGEALMEELDHPKTFTVIRSLLSKCSGVMVLIDGSLFSEGTKDHDFFAMKILSYLMELNDHPKKGWPNRPIALVFTKADECEDCFADPVAYAQNHAPGLWQQCQERFRRHQFFATGVAGTCVNGRQQGEGSVRIPLRIEPRGITAPFEWLVEQMGKKK